MATLIADSGPALAKLSASKADKTIAYHNAVSSGNIDAVNYITGVHQDTTAELEAKFREKEISDRVAKEADAQRVYNALHLRDPSISRAALDAKIANMTPEQLTQLTKLAPVLNLKDIAMLMQQEDLLDAAQQITREKKEVDKVDKVDEDDDGKLDPKQISTTIKRQITTGETKLKKLLEEQQVMEVRRSMAATTEKKEEVLKLDKQLDKKRNEMEERANKLESWKNTLVQYYPDDQDSIQKWLKPVDTRTVTLVSPASIPPLPAKPEILNTPPVTPQKVKKGTGIEIITEPKGRKLIKFGKLFVDHKKLKQGILSVLDDKKRRFPWLNNTPVSENFVKLIMNERVLTNKLPLTAAEKHLFERLVTVGDVELSQSKQKMLPGSRDYIKHLQDRIAILIGEIDAGNNALEIKNELADICKQLYIFGVMNKQTCKEVMRNMVGDI